MTDAGRPDLSTLRRSTSDSIPPPKRSWTTRIVIPAVVLAAFLALFLWAGRDALRPKLDVKTVPVVVRGATGSAGGSAVARAAGWIEPEPYAVHVAALTEGVVSEVLVLEGDRVTKDQIVARLVADDARIALDAAKAAAAAGRARVERARSEKAWADRAAANPISLIRDAASAAAEVSGAKADRDAADDEALAAAQMVDAESAKLRRVETELTNGLATASDAAEARSRLEAAKLTARAVERRRDAAEARVASMEAASKAAGDTRGLALETTRAAELAAVALTEAEADAARLDAEAAAAALRVTRLEVRAPVAGVVLERLVAPGARLMPTGVHGTDIVTLYDPATLQVRVDVPLADAAKVGAGQKARVTVEALPGKTFDGEVTRIVPQADVAKNTVQAKVRLVAPDPALRPEMLARVEFLGREGAPAAASSSAVFAPERLVRNRDGDRGDVWVVENGRAARRDVRLGGGRIADPAGEWVEVIDGLRPGDDVIDADPATLEEGRAVRPVGDGR